MCRWLERDPAGYQDGPSLYSYLGRNPMAGTDPYGLAADDAEWHHLLPQELKEEIANLFGDDFLNSTENGLILPKDVHQQLHKDGYNEFVKEKIDELKRTGKLQTIHPSWKNARELQMKNRKQLASLQASIMRKFGGLLRQGVKTLVTYSQWGKRKLSKGFFAKLKTMGRKAVFSGAKIGPALVFMFIASSVSDEIAEARIQALPEYARLIAAYEAGEVGHAVSIAREIARTIETWGHDYVDYASQFEETWEGLGYSSTGECP
jgi:hypothetical protein